MLQETEAAHKQIAVLSKEVGSLKEKVMSKPKPSMRVLGSEGQGENAGAKASPRLTRAQVRGTLLPRA